MRSYRKGYRSQDFKTVIHHRRDLPSGDVDVLGQPENPNQWQIVAIFPTYLGEEIYAQYNRIAHCDQWVGYDADGNPIDGDSGLTLANRLWNVQPYSEHPDN